MLSESGGWGSLYFQVANKCALQEISSFIKCYVSPEHCVIICQGFLPPFRVTRHPTVWAQVQWSPLRRLHFPGHKLLQFRPPFQVTLSFLCLYPPSAHYPARLSVIYFCRYQWVLSCQVSGALIAVSLVPSISALAPVSGEDFANGQGYLPIPHKLASKTCIRIIWKLMKSKHKRSWMANLFTIYTIVLCLSTDKMGRSVALQASRHSNS